MQIKIDCLQKQVTMNGQTITFTEAGFDSNVDGQNGYDKDDIREYLEEQYGENIQIEWINIEAFGFAANAEIEDLEKLGWNLDDVYEDAYAATRSKTREEWEVAGFEAAAGSIRKSHYCRIEVRENGSTYYFLRPWVGNEDYERQETGDDEKTVADLQGLNAAGKLWGIE